MNWTNTHWMGKAIADMPINHVFNTMLWLEATGHRLDPRMNTLRTRVMAEFKDIDLQLAAQHRKYPKAKPKIVYRGDSLPDWLEHDDWNAGL